MAEDVVIRAEGLGKKYIIGHQAERERYIALRDIIARNVRGWTRSAWDMLHGRPLVAGDETEEFWALKDVSFEIKRGEVVGVIGRNGAGKSTLLKILSRITEPSEGRVTIDGRVASLLEVGTGFHPELTGRENIYLNGAILGMTRAEIRRKFDEIIAFADVEKFLDTPVKRYSSGMYVRLAFAVAAHLEPEIMVVDEVLAVGDAEFQKKCLGKMGEVAGHGRTVLFVSHNMAAVGALCHRAFVLACGAMQFDGGSGDAIGRYVRDDSCTSSFRREPSNIEKPQLVAASIVGISINERRETELKIKFIIQSRNETAINVDVRVRDIMGAPVAFATLGNHMSASPIALVNGKSDVALSLDISCLGVGSYSLSIDISTPFVEYHDRAENCLKFVVGYEHWPDIVQPLRQEWGLGSVLLPLTREHAQHESVSGAYPLTDRRHSSSVDSVQLSITNDTPCPTPLTKVESEPGIC